VWPFVVAVVLIVFVVAFVIADAAAKSFAREQIRTQLVSALGLPASADVTVDVGSGSILLQALGGSLSTVDVRVPKLAFGELVGSADIHATQVPLDVSKPLGTLTASYAIEERDVSALASNLSGLDLERITLTEPEIVSSSSFSILGATVPIGLGLAPSAHKGQLVFTPTSIRVAGQTFTASALRASPIFGGLATLLLRQQPFCVAEYLPRALELSSAKVVGHRLVAGFTADGAALGGPEFRTMGTCS